MKLFLLLCAIVTITAKTTKNIHTECESMFVNGELHKKIPLAIGLDRPYQLSYYTPEKKIFFSYNVGNDTEDKFELAWIKDEKLSNHTKIEAVENGFATAVDAKDKVVYFGGSQGIYQWHIHKNKTIQHVEGTKQYNIWDMFFKHHLYFITFPKQRLYKLEIDSNNIKIEHQTLIDGKVYNFVIDCDNDTFLTNDSGLYMVKNDTVHKIHGQEEFRSVDVSNKGHVYVSAKNGIYKVDKKERKLEEVAEVKNIFGLIFDAHDNLIYSNPHQIVKLLPGKCDKTG